MRNKTPLALLLLAAALLAVVPRAPAQALVDAQATRQALSTFPDSQAVVFVNVQRIFRDVLPRVVPPAEIKKAVAEVKKNLDIDLNEIEYAIAGLRLPDPPPPGAVPEFVFVLRGNFNADALIALASLGAGTQGVPSREEQHAGKTLTVFRIAKEPKPEAGGAADSGSAEPAAAESKPYTPGDMLPKSSPYPEIAATTLDANTLLVGVPGYVRSALDAASGEGQRLKTALIDLAVSNPDTLSSVTIELPPDLPKWLEKSGAPRNAEAEKILGWLKQVSISSGMTATDYNLQAAVRTDTAEHANALSGMIAIGLRQAELGISKEATKTTDAKKRRQVLTALNVVKSITNLVQGDVIALSASVPQTTVAALLRERMKSKAAATGTKPKARRAARRKRT